MKKQYSTPHKPFMKHMLVLVLALVIAMGTPGVFPVLNVCAAEENPVDIEEEESAHSAEALSASGAIDAVNLNIDIDAIVLNTAYTEGEVDNMLRNSIGVSTEGCRIDSSATSLCYQPPAGNFYTSYVGFGEEMVQPDRKYYVSFDVAYDAGYYWSDQITSLFAYKYYSISEISGFEVTVNGESRSDLWLNYNPNENEVFFYIPLGDVSSAGIVKGVSIDGEDVSVQKGTSHSFTATVTGNADEMGVNWSVTGAQSADTSVSDGGILSVSAEETAQILTVRATAKADNIKYAEKTVTVLDEAPTIDSVTVTPDSLSMFTGDTAAFTATVTGTQTDKRVTWSVSGNGHTDTKIDGNGGLVVARDETATVITVIATADRDTSKLGTATVQVKPTTRVSDTLSLSYDINTVVLKTDLTEDSVDTAVRNGVDVSTEGCRINRMMSALYYRPSPGNFWAVTGGRDWVQADREYYACFNVELLEGYDWNSRIRSLENLHAITEISSLVVMVNGVKRTDVELAYLEGLNSLSVYVPLSGNAAASGDDDSGAGSPVQPAKPVTPSTPAKPATPVVTPEKPAVPAAPVYVTSLKLNKKSAKLENGKTLSLKATIKTKKNAPKSMKKVTWTSSDETVATVSQSGKVKARKTGSATITAAAKDGSGLVRECVVTVSTPVKKATINKKSATLYAGSTNSIELKAGWNAGADVREVKWSVKGKGATIKKTGEKNENATVTVTGKGKVTITATVVGLNGKSKKVTCKITVKAKK